MWYISFSPVEQQAQSNPSEINFIIRSIRITEKRIRGLVRNLPTGLTDNNNTHVAIFYGHSPKIILLQITANNKSCYLKIRVRLVYGKCFYHTVILNWQTQVFYLDLLFYKSCYLLPCPCNIQFQIIAYAKYIEFVYGHQTFEFLFGCDYRYKQTTQILFMWSRIVLGDTELDRSTNWRLKI